MSARRRADEFAAAVETGQVSPAAREELRAFLDLVAQLRTMEVPQVRPDFGTDLRSRLLAEAASAAPGEQRASTTPALRRPGRSARGHRAVSAAAVTCMVVGGGVGVAVASQTALPGESLYPIKRGIEQLEVATAGSAAARGSEYLEQADNRLSEIEQLAVSQPDPYETPLLIRDALDDFSAAARDGSDALIQAYREDGSTASIVELRQFIDESSIRLDQLTQVLPAELQDELGAANQDLATIDAAARAACGTCSDLAPLQLSSAVTTLAVPTEPMPSPARELGRVSPAPVTEPEPRPAPPRVVPDPAPQPPASQQDREPSEPRAVRREAPEPAPAQPETRQPVDTQPAPSEPAARQPVDTQPATTQPAPAQRRGAENPVPDAAPVIVVSPPPASAGEQAAHSNIPGDGAGADPVEPVSKSVRDATRDIAGNQAGDLADSVGNHGDSATAKTADEANKVTDEANKVTDQAKPVTDEADEVTDRTTDRTAEITGKSGEGTAGTGDVAKQSSGDSTTQSTDGLSTEVTEGTSDESAEAAGDAAENVVGEEVDSQQ